MSSRAQDRIQVWQRDRLVPLLPDTHALKAAAASLWRGMLLERHDVGAIEIPEHQHNELCLHLQLSGAPEMEWWNDGRNRVERTAPGSMILLAPGTRDRLRWTEASSRLVVSVKPELLARVSEELGVRQVDFANRWALRDAGLARVVQEMHREATDGFPLGALYVDQLEAGLTQAMVRSYGSFDGGLKAFQGRLSQQKLRRALEFMTDNLHRDLRLAEVAAELQMSESHFAHEFRASTGQTPYQYVLEQRLERAKRLLKMGGMSVKEIAAEVGFSSDTNFVRAFRKRMGITPAHFSAAGFTILG
ncbi:helix-turn-helix domain-containing protein [Granulicella cerasi]|uniref:Helix-turn-helix domain-containing protein n=1 Tax=Granulicella cerasi TaxID=741063 RepID=A0ABW1ZBY0_9BACT|nr:AraC family transcriptional regulator [Granulicella cerasi]